ncbi:tape measure protein [Providencia manganoxydans]|uniref:tape measure protein n=1 Tax=Providencia manganoxydans TaxID=2923283 RepID=UPI0032DAEED5
MADSLGFKLTLDDRLFEIKLENAERLLNRFSQQSSRSGTGVKRLESSFKGFGRTLSDTITTIGMATFAISGLKTVLFDTQKAILDSAGKLERLQVMLSGLAESSDKAKEAMRDFNFIVDRAKTAPFSIDAISDSFVKLKSAGIDPTQGSLNGLIDSVARFGGDSELLKRATVAIQQMSGKGVISMEELRQQLGEAVPTAMKAMATSMNISMGDLVKQISSGQVRAKDAIDSMLAIMEVQYSGSAERMMNTYSGLISQMQTNAALLAKTIGDSGYMDAVKDALRDINSLLASDAAVYYGKVFGEAIKNIIDAIKEMAVWVVNNQSMLTSLFKIILQIAGAVIFISFVKTVIGGLVSLNKAIGAAIGGGGVGLVGLGRNMIEVSRRSRAMGGDLNVGSIAIGRMSHAWRGLSTAMKANIIVAAIMTVIEVLSLLAWWFDKNKEKAEAAAEAARNMPSMVTDEQLNELKKKQSEQEALIKKYKGYEQDWLTRIEEKKGKSGIQNRIDKDLRELEKLRETLASVQSEYDNNSNLINSVLVSREEEAARKKVEALEAGLQKEREIRQADFNTKINELDKQQQVELANYANNAEKQKEIREHFGNLMREVYTTTLNGDKDAIEQKRAILLDQLKKLQVDLKKANASVTGQMTNDQKVLIANIESQIVYVNRGLNNLANEYDNVLTRLKDAVNLFRGGIMNLNGIFTQSITDELASQLETLAKNEDRLSVGVRVKNGEQIKLINGRIAKTKEEAEANFQILEILKKRGIEGKKLEKYYETASDAQKQQIDRALASAKLRGEDSLAKQNTSSARSIESKAEKAKRQAEKMAEAHSKLLDDAEAMSAKISFGSQEVVKYSQSLEKLRDNLEKLATAVPKEGILSQAQIDEAKKHLSEIKAEIEGGDYLNSLAKDSADQLISKWSGFANTVKGNLSKSVSEMRSEFEQNYNEADKYFQKIIAASAGNIAVQKHLEEEYEKFKAGKLEAMTNMTETATAKMAYEYKNLANLIDENIKSVFDSMEDRLLDFIKTGEFSIKDFGDFIFSELQRTFVRSMVISPMINGLGLGSGGDTGQSLIQKVGAGIGSLFPSQQPNNSDPNAKATNQLGKAATETTGALQTMQSQGIFATIAGYGKQLWAIITGTTATEVKANADITATTATGTFAGALELATGAVGAFISSLTAQSAGSSIGSIIGMVGSVGGAVAGGGASGAAATGAGSTGFETGSFAAQLPAFKNGGIMSALGEVPLKAYSKGGIATSPQLALFGEGSHNEAYVPLPDGRSIPVNMNISGESGRQGGVYISINVENNGSESNESMSKSSNLGWDNAANKIKAIVVETMKEEKRPGGMLRE